MMFRKASAADVSAVEEIYNDIHTEEENGKLTIGWIRGIYPTRATAEGALERGELFVLEDKGRVVGAGIINQDQAEAYAQGRWVHELPPVRVCVLHTLVVSPAASKKGYGTLPADKTVKFKFLGTGMISVMPVPLLAARPRGCSLQDRTRYVPSACACRWTCQVHPHRPP